MTLAKFYEKVAKRLEGVGESARAHQQLATKYEAAGNAEGARQLRAVSNLLFALVDDDRPDESRHQTILPDTAETMRPPEPEKFNEGDSIVVKAIGTIRMRIDGPHLAYVVELERREFADINAPSWATTRTAFAMPDEVSQHGDLPTPLREPDRKALQAWIDHLVEDGTEYEPNLDPRDDHDRMLANRGRELLSRLLGR